MKSNGQIETKIEQSNDTMEVKIGKNGEIEMKEESDSHLESKVSEINDSRLWTLLNCLRSIEEQSKIKTETKLNETCKLFDGILKGVFNDHFRNLFYSNNFRSKIKKKDETHTSDEFKTRELVTDSLLENIIRLMFKLSRTDHKVDLMFFEEILTEIFLHFSLNNSKLYYYLINEFFLLLIDLNQILSNCYRERKLTYFRQDIQQFKRYTEEAKRCNLNDYLLNDCFVPLTNLKVIRAYYVQLLNILNEIMVPITDESTYLCDQAYKLLDLNLDCATSDMNDTLINLIINHSSLFTYNRCYFQKFFLYVSSTTFRYLNGKNIIASKSQQLDQLWSLVFNQLDYLDDNDKTIKLLYFLIENLINLYRCKNQQFLHHTLPELLFKVFDKLEFEYQVVYHRLITRILDFYSTNLVETYLQSDEWCELIKHLLIKEYIISSSNDNRMTYSYLLKYWEFIKQNTDDFLFNSPNLLIKFINYANILLPSIHYIKLTADNLPDFFDFESVHKLVDTLLSEFKRPRPSIEHLNDELIDHTYLVVNNFIKLANELEPSNEEIEQNAELEHQYKPLTDEQIAIFYLPWHERKLKFVKDQQVLLNTLSRRNFKKSDRILRICLFTIAELPSIAHHHHQIDFFDYILKNEFNEINKLIKPLFKFYLFIAGRFSEEKFIQWSNFLLNNDDHQLVSSSLGHLSCILFKKCEAIYFVDQSNKIQVDTVINCNQCDDNSIEYEIPGANKEIAKLIQSKFKFYLNPNELNTLTTLINESSSRFFNHIDIDDELLHNVLDLFDLVHFETQIIIRKLLDGMFKTLKSGKEHFFECLKARFFRQSIDKDREKMIARFVNICEMCHYFPKEKLQIVIYLFDNGILLNQGSNFNTTIILSQVVFKDLHSLRDYFLRNKNEICQELLSRLLERNLSPQTVVGLWRELTFSIGGKKDWEQLFIETFHVVLPYLIKHRKTNQNADALLDQLLFKNSLNYSGVNDLIGHFFESLILYFMRNMNLEEIQEAIKYIESLDSNLNIGEFFFNKGTLVYSLLYEYCRQEKSINYLLSIINKEEFSEEGKITKRKYVDFNKNNEALSSFLTERMGGYLLNLNTQFLKDQCIKFKKTLLKSLKMIISIVPKSTISSYFEKLIAILRSAFKYQTDEHDDYNDYVFYIHTVWDNLISKCDQKDLADNLSVICKNLMDLLKIDPAGVSVVFKKLIVQNENHLGTRLKELHFIPANGLMMSEVNQVIKKYMFEMPDNDKDIVKFKNVLKILEESLKVENPEIKYFHYRKLLQVLTENEKCLRSFCSSANDLTVQPIISRLVYKLIADSKMNDTQLHLVIGECLGELGALDPGRLDLNQLSNQSKVIPFFYDIEESSFAILIINKLVAYFDLINKCEFQDCINYAIQELLKKYDVKASLNNEIWRQLHQRSQSICHQLFNSKFKIKEEIILSNHPVYNEVQIFSDWIVKLSILLIANLNEGFPKQVLWCLAPLITHNISLAEYILPFIIVSILIKGESEQTDFVFEEISCLIKACLSQQSTQNMMEVDQKNEADQSIINRENVSYDAKSEQYKCVHALFGLLDFLINWRNMIKNDLMLQVNGIELKNTTKHDRKTLWSSYNYVDEFLGRISKKDLSDLAASCQSYDRALMYLEEYIFDHKGELVNNYDDLQKFYVALEEPDGVEGIIVCRKNEPSLYNSILSHELNGELQEAISCCEKANKLYPNELSYSKIYLKCLLLLGHEKTAKVFAVNSIEQQPPEWKLYYQNELQPYVIEAAWKMGDWSDLEKRLVKADRNLEPKFEIDIGKMFNAILTNQNQRFDEIIKQCRLNEVDQISASSVGNRDYTRNYPKLIRLHMLNEIEHFYKNYYINLGSKKTIIDQLFKRFEVRTKNVQTSVRFKEPIISLQRVLLNICISNLNCNFEPELAELWLLSAKLARKSNNFQSAYNYLLEIQLLEQQNNKSFSNNLKAKIIIEKAKYHWQKETLEDKEKALKELSRGIEKLNIKMEEENFEELRPCLTYAKLHLLYNNYSQKTMNLDAEKLKSNYSVITACYSNWEESYYNLGIYFDNLVKAIEQPDDPWSRPAEKAEYLDKVIKNLGESLRYGSKHVYESMPKLLTSWCDLGDYSVKLKNQKTAKTTKKLEQSEIDLINKYCSSATRTVKSFLNKIPPHNFHTAISQLTSRVCHPLSEISNQISCIIKELVMKYPHQTLWLILSSILSENPVRKEIFKKMLCGIANEYQVIKSYADFGQQLCKVCLHDMKSKATSFKLSENFKTLKTLLVHAENNNVPVILPFQSFMNVQLSNQNNEEDLPDLQVKDNLVYIKDFEDTVVVLRSLVRPKKITMRGSDGNRYYILCKPKDDLRKDNRTIEFNNLVNRHLRKDSETRKRNLFIKTYTVIPLRHDCGLIEWINNLEGYRQTLLGTYRKEMEGFSKATFDKAISLWPDKNKSLKEKLQIFEKKILPSFPPIYHKFFINQFPNPTAWYNARTNYVKSCSVMSIVGYVIGLGDRHGENILVNTKDGNLVHVDFNCIFNKGAELEVPEVVPFRLTHNMVDAMGPTGYEGMFRKTCESTLRVMRKEREALISVLTTFVHDPLIEWNKDSRKLNISRYRLTANENDAFEVNKTALENLDRIRYRLDGFLGLDVKKGGDITSMNQSNLNKSLILNQTMGSSNKIPISVSYQVSHLIEEATSLERLCRMYHGWCSFF